MAFFRKFKLPQLASKGKFGNYIDAKILRFDCNKLPVKERIGKGAYGDVLIYDRVQIAGRYYNDNSCSQLYSVFSRSAFSRSVFFEVCVFEVCVFEVCGLRSAFSRSVFSRHPGLCPCHGYNKSPGRTGGFYHLVCRHGVSISW